MLGMTTTDRFEIGYHPPEKQLNELVIGPEGKLLGTIFGEEPFPIPRELEGARTMAVRHVISTLSPREQRVIDLHFDLDDGKKYTLKEIGIIIGEEFSGRAVSKTAVSYIKGKALRELRHSSRRLELQLFIPCPEGSIGKAVWGVQYGYELAARFPGFDITRLEFDQLGFSPEVARELKVARVDRIRFMDFLHMEPEHPLSPITIAEILQSFDRLKENEILERAQTERDEARTEEEKPVPENNLLPEIPLTEEQIKYLVGVKIRELALFVGAQNTLERHNFSNVGQILGINRKTIALIRNFGYRSALALGERLGELLDLPEPQRIIIRDLFLSEFPDHTSRGITNDYQPRIIRGFIREAASQGFSSPEEIQSWLRKQKKTIFGVRTDSWITQAVIEWVVNHSEEGKD